MTALPPLPILLAVLPLLVAGILLAWSVTLAGWIASNREAPRWFTTLTGMAGLLVAPAALIAVASATTVGARTVTGVAWLWPATCALLTLQALLATTRGLVSPVVGFPIMSYNLLLTAVAAGDYLIATTGRAPLLLGSGVAAHTTVMGLSMGRAALASPWALLVPLVAPAFPARWRSSALVRALIVLYATITTTLLAIEWPRGAGALRSYDAAQPLVTPRSRADFAIGLTLFGLVDGPPPARIVRSDLALLERLSPDVLLLTVHPDGTRGAALDSLARLLAPFRSDTLQLHVALTPERDAAADGRALDALTRVLTVLRPDVLYSASPAMLPGLRDFSAPDVGWWTTHLTRVAQHIQQVRPATRLGWAGSRLDATDSAVYRWATAPGSPVRAVRLDLVPSFGGLPSLDARLRAVERWAQSSDTAAATPRPAHWLGAAGLARTHGDAAQTATLLHIVSWASRREWVRGVYLGESGDHERTLGLRAANQRERGAVAALRQALQRGTLP